MSQPIYYRQCHLARKAPSGESLVLMVSWIPEKYAIVGKWLKLKNEQGEWENHWQVTNVWTRKTEEQVLAHERDYVQQRKVSDI